MKEFVLKETSVFGEYKNPSTKALWELVCSGEKVQIDAWVPEGFKELNKHHLYTGKSVVFCYEKNRAPGIVQEFSVRNKEVFIQVQFNSHLN